MYVSQEEHKNQGAWSYVQPRLQTALGGYGKKVQYVGREVMVHLVKSFSWIKIYVWFQVSSSPATGSKLMHSNELTAILREAMSL